MHNQTLQRVKKVTTNSTFRTYFFGSFLKFFDENNREKYYSKRITTRGNSNVQSHEKEESKLSRAIIVNSGAHTFAVNKIINRPFDKNNVATIK